MQLTIGKKITLGFLLGIFSVVIIGGLSFWGSGRVLELAKSIMYSKEIDRILTQSELDHLMWAQKVAIGVIDPEAKSLKVQVDPNQCNFGKWYYGEGRKNAEGKAPYLKDMLGGMADPHTKLHQSAEKINELLAKGDKEGARIFYLQEARPIVDGLIDTFGRMRGEVKKNVLDDQGMVSATRSNQVSMGVVALLFAVALSVTAIFLKRNILNLLKKIIGSLRKSAEDTASASRQISAASQSLAEGASEQAAGLEETSSSMEEMASMTRQNADNARQANTIMNEAGQVVKEADQSMNTLTRAMVEITTSSEETAKIIKTIDEIAFQTNLLALNAAVEAARAGEAGAGFAVVADEVRNLAMRAAASAKSTSDLIEGSVKTIRSGSEIVARTNEAFSKVADSVGQAESLIREIAAASQEQAQGIEEVSKAVSEMDRIVQQNASTAEESASASSQLEGQAEKLNDLVGELVILALASGRENPAAVSSVSPPRPRQLVMTGTGSANVQRPSRRGGAYEQQAPSGVNIVSPELVISMEEDLKRN